VQLIIVDEEHDVSYKQQEGSFRYHARDLAIKLAQLHDCPCVLGSATPSLKMMDKAIQHQVQYSVLNKRATGQSLPDFKIIPGTRATWAEPLNFQILKEIRDSLHSNHQVLFYLNRRGYVPRLFCVECKETLLCKSCLIPFVYHLDKKQLSCHYCGRHTPAPTLCSTCHNELLPLGFGTERLAEFLKQAFPSYPVFVIDTDHLTTHKQVTEQLDLIKKEKAALIIGTQMIGKGHDWPLVRLAVLLISAHHLENDLNDQVAQHIVQAAGRCGRHAPGTVIIPVHHDQQVPDLLTDLLKHDYESYSKHMLTVKKQECSPPYTHQAKILFRSKNLSEMLSSLRELARPIPMVLCQGPLLDYPMKRGVYWQAYLLINTSKRVQRDQLLTQMINQCQHDVILKKIYHALDIDPC
jgi:primosomal protein N' (replication factor Y)